MVGALDRSNIRGRSNKQEVGALPKAGNPVALPEESMGRAGRGQLVRVVTGVWGGVSLSRLRDVAANGNIGTSPQRSELSCICSRHLPALDYIF